MNGKMVAGKPLYVAPAQKKEERKARLQVILRNNGSTVNSMLYNYSVCGNNYMTFIW